MGAWCQALNFTGKATLYLLNVGPTARGAIPQAGQDNLRTVGHWLKAAGRPYTVPRPMLDPIATVVVVEFEATTVQR